MTEGWLMIVFGILIIVIGWATTGISDRAMPPLSKARFYPPTRVLRVALCSLSVLAKQARAQFAKRLKPPVAAPGPLPAIRTELAAAGPCGDLVRKKDNLTYF